jgi:hypothetical protein
MSEIDVRDERLAAALDLAVRGLDPEPAASHVVRRGRALRVVRTAASLTVVGAFLATVIVAAAIRGESNRPGEWTTYGTIDGNGWTVSYPEGWHLTEIDGCDAGKYAGGVVLSNVGFSFLNPEGRPPECGDRFVRAGFPADGVMVSVAAMGSRGGLFQPQPDTLFPIVRSMLTRVRTTGAEPAVRYGSVVVDGDVVGQVRLWVGDAASSADVAAVDRAIGSITFRAGMRAVVYRDDEDGLTITPPEDWFVADAPVNAELASPFEILTVATFPLRTGGVGMADQLMPRTAVEDVGPNDIFIWVLEDPDGNGYPARPKTFEPAAICGGAEEGYRICPEPTGRGLGLPGMRAWSLAFQDAGRSIRVSVAMGEATFADPSRAELAWAVLDSLALDAR